jgi:hypothetical protein
MPARRSGSRHPFLAAAVRARHKQPVQNAGKNGALDGKLKTAVAHELAFHLPLHGTLAARLCLPRLRRKQSLAAANQGLELGMRRLWQTDFGDRRHDHAPFQAAANHLVLGGLSDGDPFQRLSALQLQRQLAQRPVCLLAVCNAEPLPQVPE